MFYSKNKTGIKNKFVLFFVDILGDQSHTDNSDQNPPHTCTDNEIVWADLFATSRQLRGMDIPSNIAKP